MLVEFVDLTSLMLPQIGSPQQTKTSCREDVRAVRDEWKRQMKDTVDKQANPTRSKSKSSVKYGGSGETKLRSAENEVRAQMQVELRRAVTKIQCELDDASLDNGIENALTHAESRCAAAEDD